MKVAILENGKEVGSITAPSISMISSIHPEQEAAIRALEAGAYEVELTIDGRKVLFVKLED